jgi:predicted RNase H-like HicB family nuclease
MFARSILELFAIVFFAAIAFASLLSGGLLADATLFFALVLVIGIAITAVIGTSKRKVCAVGFLVAVTIYAACILITSKNEFDPNKGVLLTSRLLGSTHQLLVTRSLSDRDKKIYTTAAYRTMGSFDRTFARSPNVLLKNPIRPGYMLLGHVLIALTLGWLGARFATFVNRTPITGNMQLTAVYIAVRQGYIGYIEEIQGFSTTGDTLDEVRENLRATVQLVLESNQQIAERTIAGNQVSREPFNLVIPWHMT